MAELRHANSFRDLAVYQTSRSVARQVFEFTKSFPRDETYSLSDQIRRSSRAVGAQIAEAWGKRRYEKHFVSKLTDADAEQLETQHWVEIACECEYITDVQSEQLLAQLGAIGRMINSMVNKAHLFCGTGSNCVREDVAEYLA